jgi:hypothetical protein
MFEPDRLAAAFHAALGVSCRMQTVRRMRSEAGFR